MPTIPTDSLSLADGEVIGGGGNRLPERFLQSNTDANVGALHTTDSSSSSHLAILEDSDSLSLAAGEICGGYGKSPALHHSKFVAPTFGALSVTTAARENVVRHDNNWHERMIYEKKGGGWK